MADAVVPDQALRQAYIELRRCEKTGAYDRALKTCNRILKMNANDLVALRCQVICFVQLSKFEDALKVINNANLNMPFEKSYCEYRLGCLDGAINGLRSSSIQNDLSSKELLAQLLYKKEEYMEASDLLMEVLKKSSDDYDEERKTNLSAILSELCYSVPNLELGMEPNPDSYEQLYNEACFLIAKKQYQTALRRLKEAEDVCRESLTQQDATEEEIAEELHLIKAQTGCCKLLAGDASGAATILNDLSKDKSAGAGVHAVVLNNLVCLRNEQNIFDSRKKMKTCQNPVVEKQLNSRQKQALCLNNTLVSILGNQVETAQYGIETLRKSYGREDLAIVCELALMRSCGTLDKMEKRLRDMQGSSDSPGRPLMLSFALAQAYLCQEKYNEAFDVLCSLGDQKYRMGVLSVLVALCEVIDRDKACAFLSDAECRLQGKDALVDFLEMCHALYSRINDIQASLKCLNQLYEMKPGDVNILASLINAYMIVDEKKAKMLSRNLSSKKECIAGFDVDALENTNWMSLTCKQGIKRTAKVETPVITKGAPVAKKKKKRKRATKLPKSYDPEKSPDPERWLPRYERAAYRKRKDKRAKDREIGRGTQGAVGAEGEIGGGADVPASPKPTVQPVGPRQMHPAPQKPKKKKKGGRW